MKRLMRAGEGEWWKDPGEVQPDRSHMHRAARAKLKAALRKEPTEPEVHPAEVRLIEHDAGICPLGCHDEDP